MKKFRWLLAFSFAASMAWGVHAQQLLEPAIEVRGKVEQWAPTVNVIKVDGKTYTLSKGAQVMNQRAEMLTGNSVRPGGLVLLRVASGEVMHVIVNPGKEPVMDQPQR